MRIRRTISAFVLSILVLASGSSFMVGLHFCGGSLQHVAVFSPAEKCAMEQAMPPCHKKMANNCCDDEVITHEGEDFKGPILDFTFATPLIADVSSPIVLISEIVSNEAERLFYSYYEPPLRSHDLTLSHQVFLI